MQMCPECSTDNKDMARFCIRCGAPLRRLRGRGTILHGRYQLEQVLGCGGMGAVYLATDLRLNAKVAVKENLDMTLESQKQFQTEAQILATLRHPNLPRVQDYFVADGRQYLVMDYIAGESLQEMVEKRGPLPPQQAVRWLLQVMDAVRYLHSQNPPIIHRDIKPANIKLGTDGRAYLVDFGIAKILRVGSRTQAGARAVTPGFSPPEQYGTAPTDQRSDIYALGATLYFAVTGRVPPEAIERVTGRTDKLIPPRSLNPTVPPALEQVILKAMQVNPQERFASVDEMMASLQTLSVTSQPAPPLPLGKSSPRPFQPARFPPPIHPPLPTYVELAPAWLRAVAFFLDWLIWASMAWLLTFGYALFLSGMFGEPFWFVWLRVEEHHLFSTLLFAGFPLYRILAHAFASRTLGKAMMGLKVVRQNGQPCGFWRALGREVALLFAAMPCGAGLLWAAVDPHKQGWHDLAVGTFVVREREDTS